MNRQVTLFVLMTVLCFSASGQVNTPIPLYQYDGANAGARLEMADFNQDGNIDFALPSIEGIRIFENGPFEENTWIPLNLETLSSTVPLNLHAIDLDQDEDEDLIFAGGDMIVIFFNEGDFNFTQAIIADSRFDSYCRELAFGDVDMDGDLDIGFAVFSDVFWVENIDQWQDVDFHDISSDYDNFGFRGASWMDWDGDGDLDLIGHTAANVDNIVVFIQENDTTWAGENIPGTGGSVYSTGFADLDGDGILSIGMGCLQNMQFFEPGGEDLVYINWYDGLADGGQFVDLNGDGQMEWTQIGWGGGNLVYVEFDTDGNPISSPQDFGFDLPSAHDLVYVDGNGNGMLDLYFSDYQGPSTIGVVPDFELGSVGINELGKTQEAWYFDGVIHLPSGSEVGSEYTIYHTTGQVLAHGIVERDKRIDAVEFSGQLILLEMEGYNVSRLLITE
ncbi:MAG: VCBS repeat-containing protein [Flavobacteriales bacterium]|nr:VCBS repeat-containing protein [Flavobacteriales bacterium]